ncbi:MAG: hypothetical protein V1934_05495 [Methanobacteriota archaeon]
MSAMIKTRYAEEHIKVKKMIERIHDETGGSLCVVVSDLSREIKMDPRVLRNHLEVMEIDGYGQFSNTNKRHIFCLKEKGDE